MALIGGKQTMRMMRVTPIANGYAVYYGKNYIMLFNRKENAEYVANLLEKVKSSDLKNYKYIEERK